MAQPIVISQWSIDDSNHLVGVTPDGKFLRSSRIMEKGVNVVYTKSGSTYELGDPSCLNLEQVQRMHAIPYRPHKSPPPSPPADEMTIRFPR